MKKFLTLVILVLSFSNIFSQTTSFDFGADVVSRYLWRGSVFGGEDSPQIQPWGSFSVDVKDAATFTLGMWASYGLNNNYAENDIYLNISKATSAGTFSLSFLDYYYPSLDGDFSKFSNFEDDGMGAHTIEMNFVYTAPGKFPIYLMASTNIKNDPPDQESLYFEIGFPVKVGSTELSLFAGAAKGVSAWHGVTTDKFELINIGFSATKSVKITESYSLPIGMSWVFNPHKQKTFFILKTSF